MLQELIFTKVILAFIATFAAATFTNIDVIAYHLGISTSGKDFIEILKNGCNFFGIPFDDSNNFSSKNSNEKEIAMIQADISFAKKKT